MARRAAPALALNAALALSLAACAASGVMVSGAVLPSLGLYATGYFFWDPLHALSAKALLAALLVHVATRGLALLASLRRTRKANAGSEFRQSADSRFCGRR